MEGKQGARVTASFSRKFKVAQYESVDIHVGLSDDVAPGETIPTAFTRVEKAVYTEFDKLCKLVEGKQAKGEYNK